MYIPYGAALHKLRTALVQNAARCSTARCTTYQPALFVFWIAQAITAYQRLISSEGSRLNAAARANASFFVMVTDLKLGNRTKKQSLVADNQQLGSNVS